MEEERRHEQSEGPGPEPERGTDVRVLVIDDQAIVLRALRDLIAASPGFTLVGQATSGAEGLALATQLAPDLVLLDVRMPGMDGMETAGRLLASNVDAAVVLISLEPLPDAERALESGVTAFLRKQELSVSALAKVWRKARSDRSAVTRGDAARP